VSTKETCPEEELQLILIQMVIGLHTA